MKLSFLHPFESKHQEKLYRLKYSTIPYLISCTILDEAFNQNRTIMKPLFVSGK